VNENEKSLVEGKDIPPVLTSNRVLVLGSRLSGVFELAEGFQAYLEVRGVTYPELEVLRNAALIEQAFLDYNDGVDIIEGKSNPNPPKGVILLPEMRQYRPDGVGMSIDTYECGIDVYVENLCLKYGVPLVKIRAYHSPQQLTEGLKEILGIKDN